MAVGCIPAHARLCRNKQTQFRPRQFPGLDVIPLYEAAWSEADIGGDFYDMFAAAEGWMIVMGDVTGKGPGAAATTRSSPSSRGFRRAYRRFYEGTAR